MIKKTKKISKLKIFDFLNAITWNKKDLTKHPDFEKEYNPFMITRWLSMESTTTFEALFLAKVVKISKSLHFKFLLNLIEKDRIYIKYKGSNKKDKHLDSVMRYYQVNKSHAGEIVNMLNQDELENIKSSFGESKK